jgi:hypothetical protein
MFKVDVKRAYRTDAAPGNQRALVGKVDFSPNKEMRVYLSESRTAPGTISRRSLVVERVRR